MKDHHSGYAGHRLLCLAAAASALLVPAAALAQRTDDNATAKADDAFGRSIGQESIGIYNSSDVRGFSPIDAGNVRIEGLYFDRQTDPTSRLVEGSAIRVGIAAQSYPFPSPTGIADYDLRRVGDERVISPVISYGPFAGTNFEVDAQFPLVAERFGVAAGAGYYHDHFPWGGGSESASVAIMPRWRPVAGVEIMPFFSRGWFEDEEAEPFMLTRDGGVPPKIRRERFYGQPWAQNKGIVGTSGLIGKAQLGHWITRLGVFESVFAPAMEFADLFTDIDTNGVTREKVLAYPDSRYASRSGELRASRVFEESDRRHTLHLTARGRLQKRRYGGEMEVDAGLMQLGLGNPMPRPDFDFGPQSSDEVNQKTAGIAYELQWKQIGEMSVGLQKTRYAKSVATPLGDLPESRADPVLVNGTATVYATERLAFYASYTEGLEESPVAPDNALNRNVAAPALSTEQYDAGLRWTFVGNMRLVAGVFHIEKPYFDLDAGGLFRELGSVEHRGVELSINGNPVKSLTVVAGARFLDAEVAGAAVEAGLVGRKPVASARRYAIASVDYAFAPTGLSLDAVAENISRQTANTENTVEVPGRTVLHLGGRYKFTMFGKPATLRAQLSNVFDRYGWTVVSGGAYVYNSPRRLTAYLAMDL